MPDLSDSINWSETDANNNNAAPNGWPEGMMPSGVNDAARADKGALKRFWNKINPVQTIIPVGGVYTFVTDNRAYPISYVDGEIYWFRVHGELIGGDYFQVNALAPKPILKRVGLGAAGLVPIIANDFRGDSVQLVYGAGLNNSIGAFVLENPFVPISGDGSGTGVSMPGSLAVNGGPIVVNGDILIEVPGHSDKTIGYLSRHNQAAGRRRLGVTASSPGGVYFPLEEFNINATLTTVTGSLAANGYRSRSGAAGPFQTNTYNIQWTGAAAHLWIDATDEGPIVTAPGGNLVVGGNLSVASLTASGAVTAGTVTASGAVIAGSMSTAGGLSAGSITTAGNLSGGSITTAGLLQTTSTGATSGGVAIYATAGAIRSDAAGTALYLPNGDISAENVILAGSSAGGAGSNVALLCNNGAVEATKTGTAFYAPNGNVVCQGITVAGGATVGTGLVVGGTGLTVNGSTSLNGNAGVTGGLTVGTGLIVGGTGLSVNGELDVNGNAGITGNLSVGSINGHPATALFAQIEELAARLQALEDKA